MSSAVRGLELEERVCPQCRQVCVDESGEIILGHWLETVDGRMRVLLCRRCGTKPEPKPPLPNHEQLPI